MALTKTRHGPKSRKLDDDEVSLKSRLKSKKSRRRQSDLASTTAAVHGPPTTKTSNRKKSSEYITTKPTPKANEKSRQRSPRSQSIHEADDPASVDKPPHLAYPFEYQRSVRIQQSDSPALVDVEWDNNAKPIATLSHGLERVLFNPGIHWLQDPRSRVYNFTPWLQAVPDVKDFAFDRVGAYVTSSQDQDLLDLARSQKKSFVGSTSTLTGMLCHIYRMLTSNMDCDISSLSSIWSGERADFSPGQQMPKSLVFRYKDGVYAVDSDEDGLSTVNILTWLGHLLEKFLTVPEAEFAHYIKANPALPSISEDTRREAYRYAKSNLFVMRSQLDCHDPRLSGTGVFDIKTRATLPVRMDLLNYKENSGYALRTLQGKFESFEREYYDLIRSAFLKYSFQARIGNMDGVIVAYHSTARLFGFQYISLDEMDQRLLGCTGRGDQVFNQCVKILEAIVEDIVKLYPEQSVKVMFETRPTADTLKVWVEPVDQDGTAETKEQREMKMLVIDTSHTSDGSTITAKDALQMPASSNWEVTCTIGQAKLDAATIKNEFKDAKTRQFRAHALPTGVNMDEMEQYWVENLHFDESREHVPFSQEYVKKAGGTLQKLRRLARESKLESDREDQVESTRAKVILESA